MQNQALSKTLSYVLRHKPEELGLHLDAQGWVSVTALLQALQARHPEVTLEQLHEVVATNDKKRFAFSEDEQLIRANQGHSLAVDLALEAVPPPEVLYHGTATRFLSSIRASGLQRGTRQYVHLSPDPETATAVGQRHGCPVVLTVHAGELHRAGAAFYIAENGVWLTLTVPPEFIGAEGLSAS
ncbi:RNA 2'-phosphotransferase [Hymenobacter sp. BT730]|uniref:RNA 2'-phosphotransferase n=1 Tax=Hymenobacter sp. BT730 TaxID=3063332 RepID=UPI0026DEE0AE|nr:RNA 2'-phosphotransferase [Hymenobacter sp. BT730]